MGRKGRGKKTATVITAVVVVMLFIALGAMTAYLVVSLNRTGGYGNLKDLGIGRETVNVQDKENRNDLVLPEFIGITVSGKRSGVLGEKNIMTDIYRDICRYISAYLNPSAASPADDSLWRRYADSDESLYLRYHAELPDFMIASLADTASGTVQSDRNSVGAYVYELMILPGTLDSSATSCMAVRDSSGNVFEYAISENAEKVTADVFVSFMSSYSTAFKPFSFAYEIYPDIGKTIPVINGSIMMRNIMMTGDTALMIRGSRTEHSSLMRVFDMNPDKLLNTRMDEVYSFSDRRGVLSLYASSIEFRATEDGGPEVEDLTGTPGDGSISGYVNAAASIMEGIRRIGSLYTGGDADMYISSASYSKGVLTLTFSYSYDNIPIVTGESAAEIVFAYGKLRSARIYTMSVRNTGTISAPLSEWWFIDVMGDERQGLENVSPVYRADYQSESVKAEWAGRMAD